MQFKTFGEWLRHYRLQKEVSPFKMAEALGYKRVSAIYNFEYGIAPLPLTKWPAMAAVLQLSMEEFLKIMGRYSPDKVNEFRLIRGTAAPFEGATSGKNADADEESLSVITPTPAWVSDDHIKAYGLTDADTVFVTREIWESSLRMAVDLLNRHPDVKLGLFQVVDESPFPAVSVVAALKEAKTVCVLESEEARRQPGMLAARVKAAFLDALTGAEGYPEIHRVPKIYSVIVQPFLEEWTVGELESILGHLQENGPQRHLAIKVEQAVSFSAKRR
jgi:transcriptional regulator with XRE-family HTH domain